MSGFDVERFQALQRVRGLVLGDPATWRDVTESTNDDALAAAKQGAAHGALFGAETQTRGRGRRGSDWLSTPGAGLWFSVLLRPNLSPEAVPGLALCAGLAVRAAVAVRVSCEVSVKWPNDVLAAGRKLAGVLVESQVSGARVSSVVIGVGINVAQREFPEQLSAIATSLALLEARERERESLLADVLGGLELRLTTLERRGIAGLAEELRRFDALRGLRISVDGRPGVAGGIDDTGRLLLRTDAGFVEPQLSGHVQLLP